MAADPADVDAAPAETAADAALRRAALRTAVATLPPRERELIALKFHAGLDNAELAAGPASPSPTPAPSCTAPSSSWKAFDEHA